MTVTHEHDRITISEPAMETGAFVVFIGVAAVLFAGAAALVTLSTLGILPNDAYYGAGFALLFGLLFLLTGRTRMKQSYATTVTVDGHSARVSYEHTRVPGTLHVGFGEIGRIASHSRTESSYSAGDSSNRRTYTVYPVQLELTDGSSFWLATKSTREEAAELVIALSRITGRSGQIDGEVVAAGDSAKAERYGGDRSQLDTSRSTYLVEEERGRERAFTIKRIYTASDLVVLVIIGMLMSFVAFAASGVLTSDGISLGSINPIGAVGAVVPIGIVVFIIFLVIRRYRVVLTPDHLEVQIHFGRPRGRSSRSIVIPRSALRSVRTNRLENGFFRLSLGVDPDFEIPRTSSFLANMEAFRRNGVPDDESSQTIGLWMIQPWGTAPFGADFRDLRYLERRIESYCSLQESDGPEIP